MEKNQNWQCPYCGHHQVLLEGRNLMIFEVSGNEIVNMSKYGKIAFRGVSISCLNPKCKKLVLSSELSKKNWNTNGGGYTYDSIEEWNLLPDSIAKPQPDYIPASIRKDYEEACKIAHLSPNASAVLARRCLQSMIRDFCNIEGKTLHEEIEKLETKVKESQILDVTEESIQAIDSIRKMGNIGAHMQKPTGIFIDIEKDEADLLIQLIETLFKDWYVAKNERQKRLASIQKITAKKEEQKTVNGKIKNASH